MAYEFSWLFYPSAIAGLIALVLVFLLMKFRDADGVKYLILFEISAAIWTLSDGFEHASTTLAGKQLWSQISYIGNTNCAPLFFLFALEYTQNYRYINRRLIGLLSIIPLITLFLVFTNSFHHLIWTNIDLIEETNLSIYYYGSWFWVFVVFTYMVLFGGILILLISSLRFYRIYEKQVCMLIISTLLPFIGSILYVFKLSPIQGIDFAPITFIFTGILIAINIYWLRIFDLRPIARKKVIDNLSDGIMVIDMANRIIEANPAFSRITGLNVKELLGHSLQDLPRKFLPEYFNNPAVTDYVGEICLDNTTLPRYYEVKINPVNDRQKQSGKIITLIDITVHRNSQKNIEEINHQLIREIEEKEKLIMDLDAYARSVAHDLKSPISGIIGLTELIKRDYNNTNKEEAFELLDLMQSQGNKMCRIVDELLLLSRIRKEDFSPQEFNMGNIIKDVRIRLNHLIEQNRTEIELPDQWPSVKGHAQWVEEIWANLISNAIKYGGNPPRVVLGFERENETSYRFFVKDNGNGLPAESLELIFHDFERLGRKNIEGHGLGLSIVSRIIEKLGGKVKAQSSNIAGEGCTFSFTLPE